MKPKFATMTSWQQAEILMQPVFIRLIDNIRKQLEQSPWEGTYQDVLRWPEGTSPEVQQQVIQLQQALPEAAPDESATIQHTLDTLPTPIPGYELHLTHNNQHITVDLWQLCYQICFQNYNPNAPEEQPPVEVDGRLLDETGQVDWLQLDEKTQHIVSDIFATLPQVD